MKSVENQQKQRKRREMRTAQGDGGETLPEREVQDFKRGGVERR